MSLFILLTTDPSLQKDLEGALSSSAVSATFMMAGSWGELENCLESIRDVKAVIVDTRIFPAPDSYDVPVLCLVEFEKTDNKYPSISYPLDKPKVASVFKHILDQKVDESGNLHGNPQGFSGFECKLIKEIIHDLNNQFTTLRGQLPLIRETCPDEAETISDLIEATERATTLTHMLESMDPDSLPASETFTLKDLLVELSTFGKKVIGPGFIVDVPSSENEVILQGDQSLICLLLLQSAWLYFSEECNVNLTSFFIEPRSVKLVFEPHSKPANSIRLQSAVKRLNTLHYFGHFKLTVDGDRISYLIPIK